MTIFNNIPYSFWGIFASLLLLAGCAKSDNLLEEGQVTPIRIQTTIEIGFYGKSPATTRAGVEEVDYETSTYNGNAAERIVKTVRVLIFKQATIAKNILYKSPELPVSGDERKFELKNGEFLMDLELLPGEYDFILVANEQPAWNLQFVTSIPQLYSVVADNDIKTTDDLLSLLGNRGIPMVGRQGFTVPENSSATPENPHQLVPTVNLKRTLAKVELHLTNIDENGAVFPGAEGYLIKGAYLQRANSRYALMEESTAGVTPTSETLTEEMPNQSPGDPLSATVLQVYMAERLDNPVEGQATTVGVTVAVGGQDIVYTIPLYQLSDNGAKDYNIQRNTLYRINAVLQGNALTLSLNVLPWTKIETGKTFDDTGTPFGPTEKLKLSTHLPYDELNKCVVLTYDPDNPLNGLPLTLSAGNTAGALWKATITDGLDFGFTSEAGYSERGTTTAAGGQQVKVIPRRAPISGTLGTDVYFSINGVEQPIEVTFAGGVVKTFSDGVNGRLNIQSVRQ